MATKREPGARALGAALFAIGSSSGGATGRNKTTYPRNNQERDDAWQPNRAAVSWQTGDLE